MLHVVDLPPFPQNIALPPSFCQVPQSFLNPPLLVYLPPALLQPLDHGFQVVVFGDHLHSLFVFLVGLEAGEGPVEQEGLLLVLIAGELLAEPIVDVQDVVVDGELVAFEAFVEPVIVALDDFELEFDFLLGVVLLELQVSQQALRLLVVLQVVVEALSLGVVPQNINLRLRAWFLGRS